MRAKEVNAEFHICEGCDKADAAFRGNPENPKKSLRPGAIKIIEGWRDGDDDWIGDSDDYDSAEDAAEANDLDVDDLFDASYLECPNNHDSDDGWEIEGFSKIYVCGVCHTRYAAIRDAAACCDEEESN